MPSDDDLLARLNALKQSSVSLGTNYSPAVAPSSTPKPTDDLAARFARLGSASPSQSPQPSRNASTNDIRAPAAAPGAPSYLDGISEGIGGNQVEFNEEDEKSLEELLGELNDTVGNKEQWDLSNKEQQDVGKLLQDMKSILPKVVSSRAQDASVKHARGAHSGNEELTDWESIEVSVGGGAVTAGNDEASDDEGGENDADNTAKEDEEADDIIARVMAELEISRKYDPPSPPLEDNKSDAEDQKNNQATQLNDASLSLPAAPTALPKDDLECTQAIEDAFTARLAALSAPSPSQTDSLGLPSAPSFPPQKKPPIGSNLQKRIDDEIDTWCIICQDDATLKCLGCDGDLYCQLCWTEGHRGENAGFEEKMHKVVLYARKKKQTAV
jgi:hypothetical protein